MQYAKKLRKGDKVAIKSIDECKNPMCGSHEKVKTELIKGTNFVQVTLIAYCEAFLRAKVTENPRHTVRIYAISINSVV